jgi:hypothetical protein
MGIMDKMKETAAKGADMAKGGAKAAQDKLEEQKLKKRLGEIKEELGDVIYAQKTGAPNPAPDATFDAAVDRLVNEIKEQDMALATLRTESGEGEAPAGPATGV